MNKYFVIRFDDDGDYTDSWEAVADSFATEAEAREFVTQNAGSNPGIKYVIAHSITVGEAPISEVRFTDLTP